MIPDERCAPRLTGIMIAALLALAATASLAARDAPRARPNVLFLVIDDLRTALGAYGDPLARTPHLDRLAARGLLFERAYCQHALCAPSRASVMTGRRPETFAQLSAGAQGAHYREVLPDVVTLPQLFKQNGYHTESIGKVNHVYPAILDPVSWSVPERLADIVKRDEYLLPENRVGGFINPMVKGAAAESIAAPDSAYVDGQAADAAIEALRRLQDRPFFLAVGTKRPHLPWSAPEKYWRMHSREAFALPATVGAPFPPEHLQRFPWRHEWTPGTGELRGYSDISAQEDLPPRKRLELRHGYYAAVSYVDAQIGRIIDELDRLQLADHTIIVLWSDHGFHLGENGQWGKKTNTELDLRVPLIVVAPGRTSPGLRTKALVELVDLYPTLAELADLPRDPGLHGTSFVPVLSDPGRPWKPAVFSQYIRGGVRGHAVRTESHRYVEWTGPEAEEPLDVEFYRLADDPFERHNLASADPAGVARHAALLKRGWRGAVPSERAVITPGRMDAPPHPVTNPASPLMLAGDWLPGDPHQIDFEKLPRVPIVQHAVVNDVRHLAPLGFCNHQYLTHYAGRFWAMWSDGPRSEDLAGQVVKFATSVDAVHWTKPEFLTPYPPGSEPGTPHYGTRWQDRDPAAPAPAPGSVGFRYIARGFWQREGELLALATLDEADSWRRQGQLALRAFRWNAGARRWDDIGVVHENALNNFPPQQLPTGEWAMTQRKRDFQISDRMYFLIGGASAWNEWESVPLIGEDRGELAPSEPTWWTLPDGSLTSLFRDRNRSHFLFRSFSTDNGRTWSQPVRTNFPDARAKSFGMRLSEGGYALVSNPRPRIRDPLTLALSDDGLVFTKMFYLVGGRSVFYPHMMEHGGFLYVAFSGSQKTVEVVKVRIADLRRLPMAMTGN